MQHQNNIIQLFLSAADSHSDSIALKAGKEEITYRLLLERVKATAAYYRQKGIRKGDKVLVFVPMGIPLYRIVLALFYIGACPVFLDDWVSLKRFKLCCTVVPCRALISSNKFLFASWFIKELRQIAIKIGSNENGDEALAAPVAVAASDTALVTFTTGSTGLPKAANRTHEFLHAQFGALKPLLDKPYQTSLTLLPIVVLVNLGLGKTTMLAPSGFKVKKPKTILYLINAISLYAPQAVIGSPSVLVAISENFVEKKVSTSFCKLLITGGGPVFPDQAKKIAAAFLTAEKWIVYGSTEAEPISKLPVTDMAQLSMPDLLYNGLPVGRPGEGIKVAIIPSVDAAIPPQNKDTWIKRQCVNGEAGEIVVCGRHVLKDYMNNPDAKARNKIVVDSETWHRTGDVGRLDREGNLFFLGRCSELINRKGRLIYPAITAYLFKQQTAVAEVALLCRGDQLFLVIESPAPVNKTELRKAADELKLDDVIFRFVRKIPKDPRHHTKVDYERLRQWL